MIEIEILRDGLDDGYCFYEKREAGAENYFLHHLKKGIDSLKITGGNNRQTHRDLHRLLSIKFSYAIFYRFDNGLSLVVAIVDCRQEPASRHTTSF